MKKSVKMNYIFNLGYQLLLIALPLITTPYISRVLGAKAIGTYSFTQSIVTYFTLLGCIGLGLYGQREIAYHQNDALQRTKILYELILLKVISIALRLGIYFIVFQTFDEYRSLFYIQMIDIFANVFDINYFYQGLENFKKIIARNITVRFISIICVFAFIKSPQDLPLYILIQSLSLLFGNLSMWIALPNYIVKLDHVKLEIGKHVKPTLILFFPQIAVSIYTVLDRTMIEVLTGNTEEIGYYEQAQKIVKLALTIVTSLGTVMLPRISNLFADHDMHKIKEYIYQSLHFVMMIAVPIMFGIMGIAPNLVPWFLSEKFMASIPLVMMTAPIIVFIGISNVIGIQFLLPTRRQKAYTLSTIMGSIVNLICNLLLIPGLLSMGATIASVIAEASVTAFQLYCVREDIDIKKVWKENRHYLLVGACMFGVVYALSVFLTPSIMHTLFIISVGVVIYFVILFILKDKYIYTIMQTVKDKLRVKSS